MQTNRSFPVGFNYEQGIGFAEYTGYWPMPETRVGAIKVVDDSDYQHVLVLDCSDGKFYDISVREGPSDSNIEVYYKDKVGIDGTGGFDIVPEVKFKEDTGEYEKFTTEHHSSRFYIRPISENNRNATGYDSSGFPSGIEFTSKIFVDGEPVSETATANDISRNGEIVYDRKVVGSRLQTEFSANKSGFQLVGRQQDYITKDIVINFDTRITHEGDHQANISSPLLWITRGETPEYDRVSGDIVSGTVAYTTGPDSKVNSAFSISAALTAPSISDTAAKTIMVWTSGTVSAAIGVTPLTLTTFSTSGGWNLTYASGVTASGSIVLTPTGTAKVFDIRAYTGDKSSDLQYYFDDVTVNGGNNVCPLF